MNITEILNLVYYQQGIDFHVVIVFWSHTAIIRRPVDMQHNAG